MALPNTEEGTKETEIKNKFSLLEEDDEFEEFPVEDWDVESQQEGNTELNQWEDNWEDDDQIEDDFSVQLRRELEKQAPIGGGK